MTEVKNWGLEVEHRVIKSYTETQFCVIKRCFYRVDGPCYIVLGYLNIFFLGYFTKYFLRPFIYDAFVKFAP